MEGKITKLLVATGIVTAAAVSMVPLTSYAAVSIYNCGTDGAAACASSNSESEVSVTVESVLALDAEQTGMDGVIQAFPGLERNGTLGVDVRSAKPYTISLSADEPNLVNNDNDNYVIRPKDDISNGGWGIKKYGADAYSKITYAPAVFFTGQPTDLEPTKDDKNFVITNFTVGVMANETTPQGNYSTELTVLAAVQN